MIKRNLTRLLLLTTLFLSVSVVQAANNQALEKDANLFLQNHFQQIHPEANIQIALNPLSSRVKLVSCKQPVQFKPNNSGGSRVSLRANCSQPRWQIYMTAKVQITKPVLVTNAAISKGQTLQAQDVTSIETDITRLRGEFFTEFGAIAGKAAKRNLGAGKVIKSNMLSEAIIVFRQDSVIIEVTRGSLTIRTSGTALRKGKKGEQIPVRNDKSGRVVKAFVISPGLVRTP